MQTSSQILARLSGLSDTLDGTCEQTLRGIDKQKRDFANRLFHYLVVSKRLLHVEELAELFAIRPSDPPHSTLVGALRIRPGGICTNGLFQCGHQVGHCRQHR
jgi:hypothetical protein